MSSCVVQGNCSALFEDVHPAYTITQACVAAVLFLVALPLNLVLIAALVKYHHLVDKAFILCISIFISNSLFIVFSATGILLSSATRSWPLGYIVCQIYGFLLHLGILTRWITLGMLSLDRFLLVFCPFHYNRYSKCVRTILLVVPWVLGLLICSFLVAGIGGHFDFVVRLPGCFFQTVCEDSDLICTVFSVFQYVLSISMGSILPSVLYISLYIKSKMLTNRLQSLQNNAIIQSSSSTDSQNKATQTFALMMVSFSCFAMTLVLISTLKSVEVIRNIVPLFFMLSDLLQLYTIADFILLWKNQQGKLVIKKMMDSVFRRKVLTPSSQP